MNMLRALTLGILCAGLTLAQNVDYSRYRSVVPLPVVSQLTGWCVAWSQVTLSTGTAGDNVYQCDPVSKTWVKLTGSGGSATTDASLLTSGLLADARVQQSNVTQHQAALVIAASQLSGILANARIPVPAVAGLGGVFSGQCTTGTGKLMGYDTAGNRICESDQDGCGVHPNRLGLLPCRRHRYDHAVFTLD
jgi:hypothetical protein